MFCGQCGKQAGTAPPPKPRKYCQGCGNELPDGLKFCQVCGQQIPGMGFNLGNIGNIGNVGGVKIPVSFDEAKGIAGGLKINLQRLVIAGASLLGAICLFMPLISIKGEGKMYADAIRNTIVTRWMEDGVGWFLLACFVVPLVISLLGNRAYPLGKLKFVCIPCGAIVAFIDVVRLVAFRDIVYDSYLSEVTSFGFGMYLLLIPSIALCVIPFIKKLES